MSGPIIRKYGFPNFEQIFGKREMEHGADEEEAPEPSSGTPVQGDLETSAEESVKPSSPSRKKPRARS